MLSDNKNFFKILSRIDVSKYAQKRNGLDYLPWSVAWRILKENYPESYYKVYEAADGRNYHDDGRTAWVKVSLFLKYPDDSYVMHELENVEYLAVMDFKHQSIPLDKIRSTDVINTIQRALCKCAARFGIGISLYGADLDDLPVQAEIEQKASPKQTDKPAKKLTGKAEERQPEQPKQNEPVYLDVPILHTKLEAALKTFSKDMTRAEKVKFINDVVIKTLHGERNYKLCQDPKMLTELLKIVTTPTDTKEAA